MNLTSRMPPGDVATNPVWSQPGSWMASFVPDGGPKTLGPEVGAAGFCIDQILGDVTGRPYDVLAPEFAVIARRGVWVAGLGSGGPRARMRAK